MVDFVISSNVLPKHDLVDPGASILESLLAWMNYLRLIRVIWQLFFYQILS